MYDVYAWYRLCFPVFFLSVEVSNNLTRAALTFFNEKGVLLLEIFSLKKRSAGRNRNYPKS